MDSQDLRASLVAATVSMLRERHPSEISLRHVARHLGVSSGAPYHHFSDKLALLAAVALDGWTELRRALLAAQQAGSPANQIRGMSTAYLQFALTYPEHYGVMFLPELRDPVRFSELHATSFAALGQLVALVAEGRKRPPDDPEVMTRVIAGWSLVHGFARLAAGGTLDAKVGPTGVRPLIPGIVEAAVRAALA